MLDLCTLLNLHERVCLLSFYSGPWTDQRESEEKAREGNGSRIRGEKEEGAKEARDRGQAERKINKVERPSSPPPSPPLFFPLCFFPLSLAMICLVFGTPTRHINLN